MKLSTFLLFTSMFLAACSMTPAAAAATGAAATEAVPQFIQTLVDWHNAGLLSDEQFARMSAVTGVFGSSVQSLLNIVGIVLGNVAEVKQQAATAGVSPETLAIGGTLVTGAAVGITNAMRNRARISRNEPVGKQLKA